MFMYQVVQATIATESDDDEVVEVEAELLHNPADTACTICRTRKARAPMPTMGLAAASTNVEANAPAAMGAEQPREAAASEGLQLVVASRASAAPSAARPAKVAAKEAKVAAKEAANNGGKCRNGCGKWCGNKAALVRHEKSKLCPKNLPDVDATASAAHGRSPKYKRPLSLTPTGRIPYAPRLNAPAAVTISAQLQLWASSEGATLAQGITRAIATESGRAEFMGGTAVRSAAVSVQALVDSYLREKHEKVLAQPERLQLIAVEVRERLNDHLTGRLKGQQAR